MNIFGKIYIKMWEPEIKDWGKMNVDALILIFQQAKDRFEAHANTSEDITQKSKSLLFAIFAFIGAFVSFKQPMQVSVLMAAIISILLCCSIFFIAKLLSPKEIVLRGSPPIEIFTDDVDCNKWTVEEQKNLIYYREIVRYQEKIERIKDSISSRSLYFKIAFGCALLILIILSTKIIAAISHL